jgi:hypothetical protein
MAEQAAAVITKQDAGVTTEQAARLTTKRAASVTTKHCRAARSAQSAVCCVLIPAFLRGCCAVPGAGTAEIALLGAGTAGDDSQLDTSGKGSSCCRS